MASSLIWNNGAAGITQTQETCLYRYGVQTYTGRRSPQECLHHTPQHRLLQGGCTGTSKSEGTSSSPYTAEQLERRSPNLPCRDCGRGTGFNLDRVKPVPVSATSLRSCSILSVLLGTVLAACSGTTLMWSEMRLTENQNSHLSGLCHNEC